MKWDSFNATQWWWWRGAKTRLIIYCQLFLLRIVVDGVALIILVQQMRSPTAIYISKEWEALFVLPHPVILHLLWYFNRKTVVLWKSRRLGLRVVIEEFLNRCERTCFSHLFGERKTPPSAMCAMTIWTLGDSLGSAKKLRSSAALENRFGCWNTRGVWKKLFRVFLVLFLDLPNSTVFMWIMDRTSVCVVTEKLYKKGGIRAGVSR